MEDAAAKGIHQMDQAVTGMRNMAVMLAAFYMELVGLKVPPDHAIKMTCAYIAATYGAMRTTPPPEKSP